MHNMPWLCAWRDVLFMSHRYGGPVFVLVMVSVSASVWTCVFFDNCCALDGAWRMRIICEITEVLELLSPRATSALHTCVLINKPHSRHQTLAQVLCLQTHSLNLHHSLKV